MATPHVTKDGDQTPSFVLKTTRNEGILHFRLHGDLDGRASHHLEETVVHLAVLGDEIVIEMSDVRLVDIAGLNALVRSKSHIEALGGRFTLEHLPDRVTALLNRLGWSPAQPNVGLLGLSEPSTESVPSGTYP